MKKITKMTFGIILVSIILILIVNGCDMKTADKEMAVQTKAIMSEAQSQIGMPAIINFQERKLAKMIFELRDNEDLLTYTYIVNLHGELILIGRSIGYGLPYSIQYTNPMRTETKYGNTVVLPQPDPNGLFMPEGLSATWVMLIDPESGNARPIYIEQEIIVSPFKLK